MRQGNDATRDLTHHGDVELQEFFSRPILLNTYTWSPSANWTATSIDPWANFFANKRVANRISNYQNFSGRMCVKILINGNSFYYGRMMVYYVPLPVTDRGSDMTTGTAAKIMHSQRLKLFIDPCESQAGVMCLPFMWYYDKVNLTDSMDYTSMGTIRFLALNELKHANGGTTNLTISVYAWMEDVKLSMPTATNASFIVPQAGGEMDEYGSGPISNMASTVARSAGKLSRAPIIGKYARATEIAAGAGAAIAKMFGMSRPTDIVPPTLMQPRYANGFAVTDVSDAAVKLTVDSKQELTIDNNVTGYNVGDEMGLKHIASRESYLTTFNWTTAYLLNTVLFAARVHPQHYYRPATGTQYTTIPACGFVANAFKYWRGTMRYRFQIVCSGYHKGRLLFVWDPCLGTATPEQNVQYTKVVDIQEEKDFILDVAWGQPLTWRQTQELVDPYFKVNSTTYTFGANTSFNGVLTVYVLNELTTPNSAINNDIQVNVFVSMCDDAEFAVPSNRFSTYGVYTGVGTVPQSGGDLETNPIDNVPVANESTEEYVTCNPPTDASSLVYIGEVISSFRQLIKRYNLIWTPAAVNGTSGYWTWSTADFPLNRGYDLDGLRTGTTTNYNPVNTSLMRYLSFAFINYRGGVRNKFVYCTPATTASGALLTVRRNLSRSYALPTNTAVVATSQTTLEDQAMTFATVGSEGMHLTPLSQQPVLEVEFPFYRNARFAATRCGFSNTVNYPVVEELTHTYTSFGNSTANTIFQLYVAGAEDSNFSCFQGCLPFQVSPVFS